MIGDVYLFFDLCLTFFLCIFAKNNLKSFESNWIQMVDVKGNYNGIISLTFKTTHCDIIKTLKPRINPTPKDSYDYQHSL